MPAERRCGSTTPWPPNAAAERMIAPRLRGSVIPSSATNSGVCAARWSGRGGRAGARTRTAAPASATPWCSRSMPGSRSSSGRIPRAPARPRWCAMERVSFSRSSISTRAAMYSVVAGMLGPQRLEHGVAAGHDLARRPRRLPPRAPALPLSGRVVSPRCRRAAASAASLAALPCRRVVGAVLRLRRRALALERLAAWPPVPDRWALPLAPAPARGLARAVHPVSMLQCVPSAVSSR